MKTLFNKIAMLGFSLLVLCVGGYAAKPYEQQKWDAKLEAIGGYRVGEQITARLIFWTTQQNREFRTADSANIDAYGIRKLGYEGPKQWHVELDNDTSFSLEFQLVIPPDDTSLIQFAVRWGNRPTPVRCGFYFITTGPNIKTHKITPVDLPRLPYEIQKRTKRYADSLRAAAERAEWLLERSRRMNLDIAPEDSVYLDSVSESSKSEFVRMRRLESSVWTGQDRQLYMIENLYFARNPGESRFKRFEGSWDFKEGGRWYRDSLLSALPAPQYDVIIDLTNPDHYDCVRKIVDSLAETDEVGFFRTVTTREIVIDLERRKIPYRRGPRPPKSPVDSLLRLASGFSPPRPWPGPCIVNGKLVPHPMTGGPVHLLLEVTPKYNCEGGVRIMIDSIDNLQYDGWRDTTIANRVDATIAVMLELEIPMADTSGIVVSFEGVEKGWRFELPYYFVERLDSVLFFPIYRSNI